MPIKPEHQDQLHQQRNRPWSQQRRLEFIEFRLSWDGRVNRSDLIEVFGISMPQASLDLRMYSQLAPKNSVYDPSRKTYLRAPDFQAQLADESAGPYLAGVLGTTLGEASLDPAYLGWKPPVAVVAFPSRHVDSQVLRDVVTAIKNSWSLDIDYQSMSRPVSTVRRVTPHALGFDGFRWHFRAYCHEHSEFRDFLLARILRVAATVELAVDPASDAEWSHMMDIVLEPHPELSTAQRRAVELDYGMEAGRVTMQVREALLFYFLRRLGLDHSDNSTPRSRHIVWSNRDDVKLRSGSSPGAESA
jgi:hypothetical protein